MTETTGILTQNRNTLLWLDGVIGRKRGKILLLSLLSAGNSGIALSYAWLLRSLIDSAVTGDRTVLFRAVMWLLNALAMQIGLHAAIRHLEEDGRSSIENRLKERLFHCVLTKEYAAISGVHSGEWMNRLTSDTRIVAEHLISIFPGLTGMVIRLVGAIIMILILQPDRSHFPLSQKAEGSAQGYSGERWGFAHFPAGTSLESGGIEGFRAGRECGGAGCFLYGRP